MEPTTMDYIHNQSSTNNFHTNTLFFTNRTFDDHTHSNSKIINSMTAENLKHTKKNSFNVVGPNDLNNKNNNLDLFQNKVRNETGKYKNLIIDFKNQGAKLHRETNSISENLENRKIIMRSTSCDSYDNYKVSRRRVSILVDELLLKIYGEHGRKFSSGSTDIMDTGTVDCSTDSSNNIIFKNSVLLRKTRSFPGLSEDTINKWNNLIRARLMNKSLIELKTVKEKLEYNLSYTGSLLIRQLKRRDFLFCRRETQCEVITAFLQANSAKRSEDTKIQFSIKPSAGESGFQQWHGAMKMVARLPGGIPREFRKTLWLTLAERHISSKNIDWNYAKITCFNDLTNPDDDELGIQIVKDLHRTGCSLFCGSSGEQNQAVLKRVLLAYARWNKLVGYCQGFNMLAALILEVMDRCEYDSLKVMIYLIEGVLPESYFANSLRGLSIDMAVFRDLLRLKLPALSQHLENLQNDSNGAGNTYEPPLINVFTMQWFLTLFCNCLPHSTVLRVWDLIFLEGNQILLKTAIAIWDTLSNRIMPVKSADEFYSILGVLTREMLEFGLMDVNSLIKTITSIELSDLTELRERYIYNITPWTQVARKGLRLFYSDDETDDSDEEKYDDKISERAYGFLRAATKHGSRSIRSISPSSILVPFASEKDKIALDISSLKKQYSKIKERQRQAQIIFSAACNTENLIESIAPSIQKPAMNHLLLNKNISPIMKTKIQKQMTVPVSRAVQRLKETSSNFDDDTQKETGETVYWSKRIKKKRKRRRTEIYLQKTCICDLNKQQEMIDSDSSSNSSTSSSPVSSSSTELCDEMPEFDSEDANTSISECCSSPRHRLRSSSNTSLIEEDAENIENTKFHLKSEHNLRYDSNHHTSILNVLLTTSIIANDQLKKQEECDLFSETNKPVGEQCAQKQYRLSLDNIETNSRPITELKDTMSNEHSLCNVKLDDNEYKSNANNVSLQINEEDKSKSRCFIDENDNQVSKQNVREKSSGFCQSVSMPNTNYETNPEIGTLNLLKNMSEEELKTALEHMKIDALEILFSSTTLESIRNENLKLVTDQNCGQFERYGFSNEETGRSTMLYDTDHFDVIENPCFTNDTEIALNEILKENTEVLKKIRVNRNYSKRGDKNVNYLNRRNVHLSCENFLHVLEDDECAQRFLYCGKKHKSLDNLNSKSKLKIGLVSKTGKWISISIDNSDLDVMSVPKEISNTSDNLIRPKNDDQTDLHCDENNIDDKFPNENRYDVWTNHVSTVNTKPHFLENEEQNSSAYLHINFDIISLGKTKDPIKEYVSKKSMLSSNFKSCELSTFNPFPNRPNHRQPKELGIKLGLYSSNKTK